MVKIANSYKEAPSNVNSAIRFKIESSGEKVHDIEPPILVALVAEEGIEI
ncbi:MAG: hypothetical protein ACE5QV_07205 [Fidelibacterota bacterium]